MDSNQNNNFSKNAKRLFQVALKNFPEKDQGTLKLRLFGLFQVPLLFLTSPKVTRLDNKECHLLIPYRRIVKNHLGSLYFGTFAIGADACIGLAAVDEIEKKGAPISLVFKSFKAEFLKRAEGDTIFIFRDKEKMRLFIEKVAASEDRHSQPFYCEAIAMGEKVAEFELTLSLKRKQGAV